VVEQAGEVRALYDESELVRVMPPLLWMTPETLGNFADVQAIEDRALANSPPGEGGLPLLLRALAETAPAVDPAPLESLQALTRNGLRGAPPLLAAAPARLPLSQDAISLEHLIARAALFGRAAVQHANIAAGLAMLAVEAWMARERGSSMAAAQGAAQIAPSSSTRPGATSPRSASASSSPTSGYRRAPPRRPSRRSFDPARPRP